MDASCVLHACPPVSLILFGAQELRDLATQYEAQVVDKNNEVQRMEGKLQSLQQQVYKA